MGLIVSRYRSRIPAPASAVWEWYAAPEAFEKLTPPWQNVRVLERHGGICDGGWVRLQIKLGPIPSTWLAVHGECEPGKYFVDRQQGGPFKEWTHIHRFYEDGPDACILEDEIRYRLPLGPVGMLAGGPVIKKTLRRLFEYRHAKTRSLIAQDGGAGGGIRTHTGPCPSGV